MKGDNIIEAYCALCHRPITAADVHLGFQVMIEGKTIHLHHDLEIIKNETNMTLMCAVADVLENILKNRDQFSATKLHDFMVKKAEEAKVSFETLKRQIDAAMCKAKCASQEKVPA